MSDSSSDSGSRQIVSVLEARGISKRFGGVVAVDGVDLTVARGEIVGLIGPNGAGKTTLFDCLSGFAVPDAGSVVVAGRDVSGLRAEERARAGVGRTFQHLAVYPTMTVRDHLLVAAEHSGAAAHPDPFAAAETTLVRFGLVEQAEKIASDLPTAMLRRVEVARALCTGAAVLLLDEPTSGLDPDEVDALGSLVAELADRGSAALVVEHNVPFVLGLVDRLAVMATGRIIAEGDPEVVAEDPQVRAAYLGWTVEG